MAWDAGKRAPNWPTRLIPAHTRLSPNHQFSHGGTSYEITSVLQHTGRQTLSIRTEPALPNDTDLALVVDDVWLSIRDEYMQVPFGYPLDRSFGWTEANLRWTAESTVSLSLVAPSSDVPTVSISASPNPVLEGDTVTVTATLSSPLSSAVTIPVYHSTLSSITIPAGSTTGTGTITTAQDENRCTDATYPEGCEDEEFGVTMRPNLPTAVRSVGLPPNLRRGVHWRSPREVIINVIDDDAPLPTVSLVGVSPKSSFTEGEDATVVVELSRRVYAQVPIPVTYAADTDGGRLNGAEPADYSGPAAVIVDKRRNFGTATITIPGDGDSDGWEAFRVSLGTLPKWLRAGSPTSARVYIKDGPDGSGDAVDRAGRDSPGPGALRPAHRGDVPVAQPPRVEGIQEPHRPLGPGAPGLRRDGGRPDADAHDGG